MAIPKLSSGWPLAPVHRSNRLRSNAGRTRPLNAMQAWVRPGRHRTKEAMLEPGVERFPCASELIPPRRLCTRIKHQGQARGCRCYNPALNPTDIEIHSAESAPTDPDPALRFRRRHVYAALIPLAFVTGLATGFLFWGRASSRGADTAAAQPVQPTPKRVDVSTDDDPSLGPANAPVTIIEFSDFNCPYCKKWQSETMYPLLAAYPDQIRFVYRDFPITSQESAVASQAADCAGEQGAFWKFHDALLSGDYPLGAEAYRTYAQSLGLDVSALESCIASGKYQAEVEADARYAAGLGVSGTPTFFINGMPLVGAQPLAAFQAVIDAELKR